MMSIMKNLSHLIQFIWWNPSWYNGWLYHLFDKVSKLSIKSIIEETPEVDGPFDRIKLSNRQSCSQCPRMKDKKTRDVCSSCYCLICEEHSLLFCVHYVHWEKWILFDSTRKKFVEKYWFVVLKNLVPTARILAEGVWYIVQLG